MRKDGNMIWWAVSRSINQHVSPCTRHEMLPMAQELQVALACGTSLVEKRSAAQFDLLKTPFMVVELSV